MTALRVVGEEESAPELLLADLLSTMPVTTLRAEPNAPARHCRPNRWCGSRRPYGRVRRTVRGRPRACGDPPRRGAGRGDDKRFFPVYNTAVTLRQDTDTKYPQIRKYLDALAAKLTDSVMQKINLKVDADGL
jgi:hypothetical protein